MTTQIVRQLSLNFLLLVCSFSAFSQGKIEHVILIGSDGFGAYAFEKAKVPNLRKLMQEGSWTLQARTVLPSSSAPNWASMVMGAGPELHGYTKWGSQSPDLPARVLDEYGMFPTVYTLLRKEKPKSEIGVIYEWDGIGYLFPKKAVNKDQNCDGDIALTKAATTYIKKRSPTSFSFTCMTWIALAITQDTGRQTILRPSNGRTPILAALSKASKKPGSWKKRRSFLLLTMVE